MKKQVCSIRLPEEVLREIEKIAKKEDRTRGAVIRRIVQHFFQMGKQMKAIIVRIILGGAALLVMTACNPITSPPGL